MSYSANVFRIMIASPGDLMTERRLARDVIHEWNDVHSVTRKIVLLPVGWETHASPEMGQHPQEIINTRLLDKCDILVGLFWTRLGTPTNEYASGTVEEIEKHISADRPTMLYFSSQPAIPESIDPDQYRNLKEFKDSLQKRGLYESFDSASDFKELFNRHLQLKLNEHQLFTSISLPDNLSTFPSVFADNQLSPRARELLVAASQDKNGMIINTRYIGGQSLKANGRDFLLDASTREVATWKTALEALVENGYIRDRGYKGEIFEVTELGYQIADLIQQ